MIRIQSLILYSRVHHKFVKKIRKNTQKSTIRFYDTITISEIVYGAEKSQRPDFHLNNLEIILLPAVNIISFDTKAAYVCGRIRAELEKRGTPLDLVDLEIASIAIANNLTLISNNVRHFDRVPLLQYENWL